MHGDSPLHIYCIRAPELENIGFILIIWLKSICSQCSDVFVNTDVSSSMETGLKTVFLSVCSNLQHIGPNLRFLKFFASLDERYDAKCRQN